MKSFIMSLVGIIGLTLVAGCQKSTNTLFCQKVTSCTLITSTPVYNINENTIDAVKAKNIENISNKKVTAKDLENKQFVLIRFNNQEFLESENGPYIKFSSELQISGENCNNFSGAAQLNNNTLTVKNIAMTRKLCSEEYLNNLDTEITDMLEKGASISLQGNQLTLQQGDNIATYRLK